MNAFFVFDKGALIIFPNGGSQSFMGVHDYGAAPSNGFTDGLA